MLFLFLQDPPPVEPPPPAPDPGCIDPATGQACQVVQLDPQQLQTLIEYAYGQTYYVSGLIALCVMLLGGLAMTRALSGR